MSERKVFIRSNQLRVVVKPHPGVGQIAGNAFNLKNHAAAVAHAAKLAKQWGCEVVDET